MPISATPMKTPKRLEVLKEKMRDLDWRDMQPIGIEVMGIDELYAEPFAFPNLAKALNSSPLKDRKYPLYAFLGAQPVYVDNTVKNVPYIVLIDCPVAPPSTLANHSLQQESESLIDMKSMGMGWQPYLPKHYSFYSRPSDKVSVPIYTLDWHRRPEKLRSLIALKSIKEIAEQFPYDDAECRSAAANKALTLTQSIDTVHQRHADVYLRFMRKIDSIPRENNEINAAIKAEIKNLEKNEDIQPITELKKWEYLVPMIDLPATLPEEPKAVTSVTFDFVHGGKKYEILFDKQIDRLATFIPEFIEDNKLKESPELSQEIEQAIREAFKGKRAIEQKFFDERHGRMKQYSPSQLASLEKAQFYKFYPNHPTIDVEKFTDSAINLYFGPAHHTVKPDPQFQFPSLDEGETDRSARTPARTPARKRTRSPAPSSIKKRSKSKK